MPKSKTPTRKEQYAHGGLGAHFTSPQKRRMARRKTQPTASFAMKTKVAVLKSRLAALHRQVELGQSLDLGKQNEDKNSHPEAHGQSSPNSENHGSCLNVDIEPSEETQPPQDFKGTEYNTDMEDEPLPTEEKKLRRLIPDQMAEALFARWNALLPGLIPSYLQYIKANIGKDWTQRSRELESRCSRVDCPQSKHQVVGLLFASKRFATFTITICNCQNLPSVLVINGLFPTSPHAPRMGISVELLDLLLAVSERSSDAVTALATALNNTYRRRGFVFTNSEGQRMKQPFRRGLGYALRWYDCLHVMIERRVESAIEVKFEKEEARLHTAGASSPPTSPTTQSSLKPSVKSPFEAPLSTIESGFHAEGRLGPKLASTPVGEIRVRTEAHPILQARCPACFGGRVWGAGLASGGDVHVAFDCCFNHRHLRSVANSPGFHIASFILSKQEVDGVGERIEAARNRPMPRISSVPDESIDSCQESHEAGTGSNMKTSLEKFDIGGLAALVCRHEVPLFAANVDTPGEQQKYSVALVEHLLALLPPNATVSLLYDIGCVIDRSSTKYDIFSQGVRDRIQFATSVMHSYVHQWSCQLHYNPRMKIGLGLSDGENVERLWSRMRKLIGVCRQSSMARRHWLIDRSLAAIAFECRQGLGEWMRRKLDKGVGEQQSAARQSFKECGLSREEILQQWMHQKETQLSVRAHAPARLKKELDQVLRIQNEANALGNTVSTSFSLIKKGVLPLECKASLKILEERLLTIHSEAQNVYLSLNVNVDFPTLDGVDLDFIRKLFMLRELKASVQKRATAVFWEFDKLDQATGGTKMHQHVRAAMSKKTKALEDIVKRYNGDCRALERLSKPHYKIPIPTPLPTELSELKQSATLMETIWVDPLDENTHRWVRDPDVREGIRAMHKIDRCLEERRRLGKEADNMARWYGRRSSATVDAMRDPANQDILCILQQEYGDLLALANEWENPLLESKRLLCEAARLSLDGVPDAPTLSWITTTSAGDSIRLEQDDFEDGAGEDSIDIIEDLLLHDLAEEQVDYDAQCQVYGAPPLAGSFQLRISPAVSDLKDNLLLDRNPLQDLQMQCPPLVFPGLWAPRRLQRTADFGEGEFRRLQGMSQCLNDECINGLSKLIQQVLLVEAYTEHAQRCAIFSSYTMVYVNSGTPENVWAISRRTEYWRKDIWLVPIHDREAQHWVLAVILPYRRAIYFFDSLADDGTYRRMAPTIMGLIRHLSSQAGLRGQNLLEDISGEWTAYPLTDSRLQTNSYDCGVWVLACIAAVLRGYHLPGLSEGEISEFRSLMLSYALSLPLSQE